MIGRIVHVVGARPQFVKLAPVLRAQARHDDIEPLVVHTGQHYDAGLSQVFFDELGLPAPAAHLGVGSGPHGEQTGRMLEALERTIRTFGPVAVAVYGDTNSTLAGALAAAKLGVPVAHVEAGLRSFNRRMPEEMNRVATDHLCDLLLAPTRGALEHLEAEGLSARSEWVGDVMADALLHEAWRAMQQSRILEELGLAPGGYGVATLHRAESTTADALPWRLEALAVAARQLDTLVLPLHPRTRAAIGEIAPGWPALAARAGVRIVDPLGPRDMLSLATHCTVIVTDSGGLQKEAFLLGTPCVTLRAETEWTETIEAGANVLANNVRAAITAIQDTMLRPVDRDTLRARALVEYGGGRAGERVADALRSLVRDPRP